MCEVGASHAKVLIGVCDGMACIFKNLPGYSGERRRGEDATHAHGDTEKWYGSGRDSGHVCRSKRARQRARWQDPILYSDASQPVKLLYWRFHWIAYFNRVFMTSFVQFPSAALMLRSEKL